MAETITVGAGDVVETDATMDIPTDAELGVYEGNVLLTNDEHDKVYRIPFAIRVTEKGIDYVEVSPPAMSTDSALPVFSLIRFKLNSELETIDVVVNDEQTGDPVGFVGTMDTSGLSLDKDLGTQFNGKVYPFTDDPDNPISEELTALPEGTYQLEVIGHEKSGETYKKQDVFIVDNTPPEMTFLDYEPGIHEVDDSMFSEEDG